MPAILCASRTEESNHLAWLLQIDSWDFDIFQLSNLTNGRPLYTLCMTLMEREGLLVRFRPHFSCMQQAAQLVVLSTPLDYMLAACLTLHPFRVLSVHVTIAISQSYTAALNLPHLEHLSECL